MSKRGQTIHEWDVEATIRFKYHSALDEEDAVIEKIEQIINKTIPAAEVTDISVAYLGEVADVATN